MRRALFLSYCLLIAGVLCLTAQAQMIPLTGAGGNKVAAGASFLLDSLSATSSVAYSSRKLRSAYAGNAMKVRRNSDNATQDIGFGGSGNLDTSALATFCGANSCFIDTKYDQSGNVVNATQSTAGDQPRVVNAGTNDTQNAHVCPLYGIASSTLLLFAGTTSQPNSIGFVTKLNSTDVGGAKHFTDGGNTSPTRQLVGQADATHYILFSGGGAPSGGTNDTNIHGLITIFDSAGTNTNLYEDGTNVIVNQNTGTQAIGNPQWIGAGQGPNSIDGFLCEYIVLTSAAGSTDRSTIRTSWQSYWGTP